MLLPEQRVPDLLPFVEQELFYVVHAARQTGKSTAMIAFAARLRDLGYAAVRPPGREPGHRRHRNG